jgi:hypothetical protein
MGQYGFYHKNYFPKRWYLLILQRKTERLNSIKTDKNKNWQGRIMLPGCSQDLLLLIFRQ